MPISAKLPPAGRTPPTLFDEVDARLPLFEGLPDAWLERLAGAGLGRGLLTASLRARLRKGGFHDLAMLALATPTELGKVRKFGPVRIRAVRAFLLEEIGRLDAGARSLHDEERTADRRRERLRGMPGVRLPLDEAVFETLGVAGCSCLEFASRRRADYYGHGVVASQDLDRVVTTLVRFLLEEYPRVKPPAAVVPDGSAREEARLREERARIQEQRDREWDDAAPRIRLAGR